jgi:hypothetical protein
MKMKMKMKKENQMKVIGRNKFNLIRKIIKKNNKTLIKIDSNIQQIMNYYKILKIKKKLKFNINLRI